MSGLKQCLYLYTICVCSEIVTHLLYVHMYILCDFAYVYIGVGMTCTLGGLIQYHIMQFIIMYSI